MRCLFKSYNTAIEFGDWKLINNIYWLREDLSPLKSDWACKFGHNNAIGFLLYQGKAGPIRIFGDDIKFLIDEWLSINTTLSSDIEKAKQTIDNFLQQFN